MMSLLFIVHELRRRAHASNEMISQSMMSLLHKIHKLRRRAHIFVRDEFN
jgi:hypothetical protein